jgi:hypothetical protein
MVTVHQFASACFAQLSVSAPSALHLMHLVHLVHLMHLMHLVHLVHLIGLFLVNRSGLPAAVVPAIGAHAVRRLRFVTVRALAQPYGCERVVRAALGRARLRVSSFWIRHRLRILSSLRAES